MDEAKKWTEADVVPYTVWRHVPSGSVHIVLGVALCTTNGSRCTVERSVVYLSYFSRELKYREVGEFLNGQYERVDRSVWVDPPIPKE